MKYQSRMVPLLMQLRMVADQEKDNRSLVAIAADFERKAKDFTKTFRTSVTAKAHSRNT